MPAAPAPGFLARLAHRLAARLARHAAGRLFARLLEAFPAVAAAADVWCRGRSALARAPLLLYVAWLTVQHLRDPDYHSLFGALNLGVHEIGHLLWSFAGQFLGIAGGTITQCAAPVVGFAMFRRQGDWFAMSFACGWLGINFYEVATYVADARALDLPLVSVGGGEVVHDWNYLLDAVGLLAWDETLGTLVRCAATTLMALSLGGMGWLLFRMVRNP